MRKKKKGQNVQIMQGRAGVYIEGVFSELQLFGDGIFVLFRRRCIDERNSLFDGVRFYLLVFPLDDNALCVLALFLDAQHVTCEDSVLWECSLHLNEFAVFHAIVGQAREHFDESVKIANAVLLQHLLQHVARAEFELCVFVVLEVPQRRDEHIVSFQHCDVVQNQPIKMCVLANG